MQGHTWGMGQAWDQRTLLVPIDATDCCSETLTTSVFLKVFKKLFCLFEKQIGAYRESYTESSHLTRSTSPNARHSWSWAGPKLAGQNAILSPMWVAGIQLLESLLLPSRVCMESGWGPRLEPRYPKIPFRGSHHKWILTRYPHPCNFFSLFKS